jgi:hypothetical protein
MVPILTAMAIAMSCAYLVMAAAAVPRIIGTASYLSAAAFAVAAVGGLALVAAACIGLAVGRLVPSRLTAPVLAVAGYGLLMLLLFTGGRREWLALVFSPMYVMSVFTDYETVSGQAVPPRPAGWRCSFPAAGGPG